MKKRPRKKVPKRHKAITVEAFAGMVQGSLVEMHQDMRGGFSQITLRIDGVEQKVDALRGEVMAMHYDHKKMQARMESLEIKVFGSIQEQ
ncbi:hypothetical protein HY090_02470 [Candidatus Kaiserbacteria bacterium]|nr:hypothetical protein [Candidatus Kaiserbacteria bacterium]